MVWGPLNEKGELKREEGEHEHKPLNRSLRRYKSMDIRGLQRRIQRGMYGESRETQAWKDCTDQVTNLIEDKQKIRQLVRG